MTAMGSISTSPCIEVFRYVDPAGHIDKCQCEQHNGRVTVHISAADASSGDTTTASDADACCVSGPPVDHHTAQDLARVFKALGDPTRVKLLAMIVASAAGELCVCDLTEPVGLSQPTVSHHMKLLVEAGLVTREQRGKWAYYQPTTATLVDAVHTLLV